MSDRRYRVWIAQPPAAQAANRDGLSTSLVALEPAEPGVFSARQARCYVAAFNRAARRLGSSARAVAVAVTLRYEGDPQPGCPLRQTGELQRNG